jgi:gluconate kinase
MMPGVNEASSYQGILINGTIGAGKTAVAEEIGDRMEAAGARTAVLDLDWLGWIAGPVGPFVEDLILKNLQAVWPNFRAAGADRVVLARALDDPAKIQHLKAAIPDVELTVVRLVADIGTIEERLRRRDTGGILEEHLVRSPDLASAIATSGEDHVVDNADRSVAETVDEILRLTGWMT